MRSLVVAAARALPLAALALLSVGCAGIVGLHDLPDDGGTEEMDASDATARPVPDAAVDSAVPVVDSAAPSCAASCPAPGTCKGEVCSIDCTTNQCQSVVKCPADLECDVDCNGGSCGAGIDCSEASKCVLRCQTGSCNLGKVYCDGTGSTLECDPGACLGGVSVGPDCQEKL